MAPKQQKFFVKLARPRVDVAIVEVEATDDEDDSSHLEIPLLTITSFCD